MRVHRLRFHAGFPSWVCWPVRLRRYPRDEAVTCISWRAPLVAEAPPLLRRITRASTDGALPSIRYFRWASTLELVLLVPGHRRHGGKLETVSMVPRFAAGLPSLPPDTSGRVRFDRSRGRSKATIHDLRGPRPHRPHDCSRGRPDLPASLPAAIDPRVAQSTAIEAFTWMHPETRRSRTYAAYLLSIFKDVHPVGAPFATRSSWRSGEAPRHAALASLWFERAPLEP